MDWQNISRALGAFSFPFSLSNLHRPTTAAASSSQFLMLPLRRRSPRRRCLDSGSISLMVCIDGRRGTAAAPGGMRGRAAWWPRCGRPMLCSDGPPLLDGCRWLSLVRFPVVAYVEPWVRLTFALRLYDLFCRCVVRLVKDVYACFRCYTCFGGRGSSMRFAVAFVSVCGRRGWLCSCWCRIRAPSGTVLVLWRSLMKKPS